MRCNGIVCGGKTSWSWLGFNRAEERREREGERGGGEREKKREKKCAVGNINIT